MPIDSAILAKAMSAFEAFMRTPFPDKPEGDEFGDRVMDLLLLEPSVAAKLIAARNGHADGIDLDDLRKDLDELSLLESKFDHMSVDPVDAHLRDKYIEYIHLLYRAGDLLFQSRLKCGEDS
ncbi:hypothetical protein ACOZ38_07965 [Sphaerisporangium viridialbum]|uniref:hypothetical protein n=1 Tax=Sphaerisporangium viridialbum TaxID=46189 RepID=UPI003C707CA0